MFTCGLSRVNFSFAILLPQRRTPAKGRAVFLGLGAEYDATDRVVKRKLHKFNCAVETRDRVPAELSVGIEPTASSLPRKCSTPELRQRRAGDEIRTRDPQLGRLTLYQLSYSRILFSGGGRIRTFEGIRREIYSLLPLAARALHQRIQIDD